MEGHATLEKMKIENRRNFFQGVTQLSKILKIEEKSFWGVWKVTPPTEKLKLEEKKLGVIPCGCSSIVGILEFGNILLFFQNDNYS